MATRLSRIAPNTRCIVADNFEWKVINKTRQIKWCYRSAWATISSEVVSTTTLGFCSYTQSPTSMVRERFLNIAHTFARYYGYLLGTEDYYDGNVSIRGWNGSA
jgi:hypothetical protein